VAVTTNGGATKNEIRQIGDVAEALGLSLRTIRHWEETGLVLPSGRSAGFRLYADADVERLRLVKQMKPLGFIIEEMREVLSLCDRLRSGDDEAGGRTALVWRLEDYTAVAAERCAALRVELAAARAMTEQFCAESNGVSSRGGPR
jgi:DNA-binding transcriptional MerR regulator